MTVAVRVAAVDLGASSGRVMAGVVGTDVLGLDQVHRFSNRPVSAGGSLHWDILGIHREMVDGLRTVARSGQLDGIGIDSWAVDYGLLDRDGHLLGNPFSYRDGRTEGVMRRVASSIEPSELYQLTGVQQLPFNTIYQLAAERGSRVAESARTMLLLPDLLAFWLTGEIGAERTNASTTQLYDVRRQRWAMSLAARVGVHATLLPPLRDPGSIIGPVTEDIAKELGLKTRPPVIAVASHDTASAVVAVPAEREDFAYISSGTWSLVGLELSQPVLTEEARLADFTNEGGLDGTTRFLKNVMGLWVLSESVRTWADRGVKGTDLSSVLAGAAQVKPLRTVVDINDRTLLPPGNMPARIVALARNTGQPLPASPADVTRTILDSLALAYRRHLRRAAELAGREFSVVHIVGGGTNNSLLCQLTADACGVPVFAGPTEAAALGNVLVQARALGADLPDLHAMRALVRRTQVLRRYEPRPGVNWDDAEAQVFGAVEVASP